MQIRAPEDCGADTITFGSYGYVSSPTLVPKVLVAIDSVPATQSARDALRQEYLDWRIPVPPDTDIRNTATYAGIPGFSLAEVNWGDHGWIVVKDTLATMLPLVRPRFTAIMLRSALAFEVTSMFRNPVHNRLHSPSTAALSPHQYGVAADMSLPIAFDSLYRILRQVAKQEFRACVEPRRISPRHLHVDWPPFAGRPECPRGW